MMTTRDDRQYVNDLIPKDVKEFFQSETCRMATGEKKMATLPNHSGAFDPLANIHARFQRLSQSSIMEKVDDVISQDD